MSVTARYMTDADSTSVALHHGISMRSSPRSAATTCTSVPRASLLGRVADVHGGRLLRMARKDSEPIVVTPEPARLTLTGQVPVVHIPKPDELVEESRRRRWMFGVVGVVA